MGIHIRFKAPGASIAPMCQGWGRAGADLRQEAGLTLDRSLAHSQLHLQVVWSG